MSSAPIDRTAAPPLENSFSVYLREIGSYPLLSASDERTLARRARAGDADAVEQLICANLRFVVSVAKKYRKRGLPLADLVDEGNLGLLHAVERFDETKGVRLISYAVWWVRQAVLQALTDHAGIVRIPVSRTLSQARIRRHANRLRHHLGREPTRRELLAGTGFTDGDVVEWRTTRPDLSLDAALASGDRNLSDYLADDVGPRTDDHIMDQSLATSVEDALAQLDIREAKVLRLYFGLDGGEATTLEEIGAQFGITRERARQIKEKALWRLRKSRHARVLSSFRQDAVR